MQNHYNLVYREEEREMLPLCRDQGVGVIPWSPLARGFLAGNRKADGKTRRDDPRQERRVRPAPLLPARRFRGRREGEGGRGASAGSSRSRWRWPGSRPAPASPPRSSAPPSPATSTTPSPPWRSRSRGRGESAGSALPPACGAGASLTAPRRSLHPAGALFPAVMVGESRGSTSLPAWTGVRRLGLLIAGPDRHDRALRHSNSRMVGLRRP